MGSDNPSGADNQQETEATRTQLDPWWVVGFVDGEGCFSVAIHRNPQNARRTGGWQLTPVFQVYQHEDHRGVLEDLCVFYGCGRIRSKGPRSSVLTYSVSRLSELNDRINPFFKTHRLRVKDADFRRFVEITSAMARREHWSSDGFDRLVRIAYSMNAHGRQRSRPIEDVLQGSSETVRQAPQ